MAASPTPSCFATRRHMRGLPDFPLPGLRSCLDANLSAARLTNPVVRCIGVADNTSKMTEAEARQYLKALADDFGLPACDPVRTGVGPLVGLLMAREPA